MEIDLQRFISTKVQEGNTFKATKWIVIEFNIGNVTWNTIKSKLLIKN